MQWQKQMGQKWGGISWGWSPYPTKNSDRPAGVVSNEQHSIWLRLDLPTCPSNETIVPSPYKVLVCINSTHLAEARIWPLLTVTQLLYGTRQWNLEKTTVTSSCSSQGFHAWPCPVHYKSYWKIFLDLSSTTVCQARCDTNPTYNKSNSTPHTNLCLQCTCIRHGKYANLVRSVTETCINQ